MLSDPVAEAFGLIHRHPSGENFGSVSHHPLLVLNSYPRKRAGNVFYIGNRQYEEFQISRFWNHRSNWEKTQSLNPGLKPRFHMMIRNHGIERLK